MAWFFFFHKTANPKFTFKEKTLIEQVSLAVSLYTRIREALLSSFGCTSAILINFREPFRCYCRLILGLCLH